MTNQFISIFYSYSDRVKLFTVAYLGLNNKTREREREKKNYISLTFKYFNFSFINFQTKIRISDFKYSYLNLLHNIHEVYMQFIIKHVALSLLFYYTYDCTFLIYQSHDWQMKKNILYKFYLLSCSQPKWDNSYDMFKRNVKINSRSVRNKSMLT